MVCLKELVVRKPIVWVSELSMGFNDIANVSIKANDYKTHFWYMSNDETINVLRDVNLIEKKWIIMKQNLFSFIKHG